MIRLRDVVIDCHHPASLARFWAGVIDDYEVAPYDDEEVARLAALGIADLEHDPGVMVVGSSALRLYFQRVPEPKVVKNRVHIDLQTDEPDAALARVVALGGQVLQRHETFVVAEDPEHNEFCMTW
jgi:Glyoxalase-like domain